MFMLGVMTSKKEMDERERFESEKTKDKKPCKQEPSERHKVIKQQRELMIRDISETKIVKCKH